MKFQGRVALTFNYQKISADSLEFYDFENQRTAIYVIENNLVTHLIFDYKKDEVTEVLCK